MQDQHFLKDWNAGHARFSEDFDDALRSEAQQFRNFVTLCCETPLARKARMTAKAVMAGVLAGAGLAATLMLLTTAAAPGESHAAMACMAPRSLA